MTEHHAQIGKDLVRKCPTLEAIHLHEVSCYECKRCGLDTRISREDLEAFTTRVFRKMGVPEREAYVTARILVYADLRGIPSHGVARLGRYIAGIREGYIRPDAEFDVQEPTPSLAVIDAANGLGQVVSERAMDMAIDKADQHGVGVVTVRNSNHYGIAGYYVLKAIERGMIGLSMTNSAPLVIPTHGATAMLGTNPIAIGAPAGKRCPFLLDMATSVVPRGKLEVYDRNRQQMPVGWAADEKGFDCQNPGQVLKNLLERAGGGILPLGGRGEEFSGYKGYGLALMVDVLCGVLAGSAFGPDVHNLKRNTKPGEVAAPRVGHFFMAIDIERFMPRVTFENRLAEYMDQLRDSPRALDQDRIWIHGEKEYEKSELHEKTGIPMADNVLNALRLIAAQVGVEPPFTLADKLACASCEEQE